MTLKTLLALAATTVCITQAHAVGYRLPNQDPEGIARGNAFAATADNPSAIYYNPAGITQLEGHDMSLGVYLISTDVGFQSTTGGSASTDTGFQAVPQIYYTYSPADSPLSFGLGMYAPYEVIPAIQFTGQTSVRRTYPPGEREIKASENVRSRDGPSAHPDCVRFQYFRSTATTTPRTSTSLSRAMIGDIASLAGCSRILPGRSR